MMKSKGTYLPVISGTIVRVFMNQSLEIAFNNSIKIFSNYSSFFRDAIRFSIVFATSEQNSNRSQIFDWKISYLGQRSMMVVLNISKPELLSQGLVIILRLSSNWL